MRRILFAIASLAVLTVVALGVMHVVISPVNPEQKVPSKHAAFSCWACHIVTSQAKLRDVK